MFGKLFIGVILPQAPVYLTQTNNDFPLSPVKSWNKYLTIWIELWAHKMQGFTRFVVKTNKSWFTRFWGKILNSNFHPCKKFDILQVCLWELLAMFLDLSGSIAAFQTQFSSGWGMRIQFTKKTRKCLLRHTRSAY